MVAYLSYYAQSFLRIELMELYDKGDAAAGGLNSIENTAFFVTMMMSAAPMARLSRAKAAIFGGVVLVLANIASAYAPSWEVLTATRIVAGFGGGIVAACGTAALASSIDPDRAFAIAGVASGLLYPLEPLALPHVMALYDVTGGYLLLALWSLVFIPLFIWLLPPREAEGEPTPLLELMSSAPNRMLGIFAIVALFSFEVGQGAVYEYVATFGEFSGLDKIAVGQTIGVTGWLGMSGGVFAILLGTRFGRKWPIIIGLVLNSVAAAGLALQSDPVTYWLLNLLWGVAYSFSVPYLMGALAALDDRGRWVVAADGAWNGGTALGPWLAGLTVQASGHAPLAMMALSAGLVGVVLMTLVVTRLQASEHEADEMAPAEAALSTD